ncbi:MAG: hypothetical protein ABI699_04170 [Caldimonas sp.]
MKARQALSRTGYTVRGTSLAEVARSMAQKCPRDPFGVPRLSGAGCDVEISHDLADGDLRFETRAASSPLEVKATLTGGTMLCSCELIYPKIASESDLKPLALKEWKRFRIAAEKHALALAAAYLALTEKLAAELAEVSAVGKAKDEKAAKAEARRAVGAILDNKYDAAAIKLRIKFAAKLYNARTRNGAAKGALLNIKVRDG